MKRPRAWWWWILVIGWVLCIGQYVALMWLAPRYVMRVVERVAGGKLFVGGARLSFPLTTVLTDLRLTTQTPEVALHIQRLVVKPRWVSVSSRTVWVDAIEIDRPLLRLTRTSTGAIRWPSLPDELIPTPQPGASEGPSNGFSSWRLEITALKVIDGVVEFIDEKPTMPFHGIIDHASLVIGPVATPLDRSNPSSVSPGLEAAGMSFAMRGELVGYGGGGAPLYCSGWFDQASNDLQASCRVEPLVLSAFEPYYHGPSELRVYTTTLTLTSQWWARSNEFHGRIQLELNQLSEGDLSIRGRTIVDVKHLTGGREPRLSGEVRLTGPLNAPSQWHAEFLPGDELVQHLVQRLLDRGVEVIRLPLWGNRMSISLTPASKATMTDIEVASKEVQEALEILAVPPAEQPVVETLGEATASAAPPLTQELLTPPPTPPAQPAMSPPADALSSPVAPGAPPLVPTTSGQGSTVPQ